MLTPWDKEQNHFLLPLSSWPTSSELQQTQSIMFHHDVVSKFENQGFNKALGKPFQTSSHTHTHTHTHTHKGSNVRCRYKEVDKHRVNFSYPKCTEGFPRGTVVKNLPANEGDTEMQVWSLGGKDPLEKGMATHSSIPAWKIPRIGEPDWLQNMGSQRVRHDWAHMH